MISLTALFCYINKTPCHFLRCQGVLLTEINQLYFTVSILSLGFKAIS